MLLFQEAFWWVITGLICQSFELRRGQITKRTMSAASVVKDFDKAEDFTLSLGVSFKPASIDALQLERTEKSFYCGIIVTTALTTHAGNDPVSLEQLPIGGASILHTPIGMMDETFRRPTMSQSQRQGRCHQLGAKVVREGQPMIRRL